MDRNFHTDDFERLLREKSDQFKMYPSKRIWHSVYNNIHPGQKWPSVAMCITLISALLLVGYLNTRNTSSYTAIKKSNISYQTTAFNNIKSAQVVDTNKIVGLASSLNPFTKKIVKNSSGFKENHAITTAASVKTSFFTQTDPFHQHSKNPVKKYQVLDIDISSEVDSLIEEKANIGLIVDNYKAAREVDISTEFKKDFKINAVTDLDEFNVGNVTSKGSNEPPADKKILHTVDVESNNYSSDEFLDHELGNKVAIQIEKIQSRVELLKFVTNKIVVVGTDDKNWIDNYALYNRPAPKKWANKFDWQIYATPSVVYRTLNSSNASGSTLNATPFAISSSNQNINSSVTQTPSLGLEVGTGLNYLILKNVRIKGAFQLNFTRYDAHAFANSHPVATKLTMHNFETKTLYEVYRSTGYSNNSGLESIKLHNETFQISLPVGIDLKLIGNERLQWNIGATIQPTFVAGGKSYLISSDRHNYVKEASMMNRWNLNAGFETFVSFRSNGLIWQIGPQFRKQLFSTNSKTFAVEEKLVSYGIKFGISKTLN